MLSLRPSDIYYSQDSIKPYFDEKSRHSNSRIGHTLDAICNGRCYVDDIPNISVCWLNNKWVTADNRRLWIFRHLERLQQCKTIEVFETYYIPGDKLTSINGGTDVIVRGNPGGVYHGKAYYNRGYEPWLTGFNDDCVYYCKTVYAQGHCCLSF